MKDTDIIDLYFARNEQAITETAVAYGRYCMGISMGILDDRSDAEECVNDTYLKAWQTIPPTRPQSLKVYLGRIIRNLSLSRYRHRHRKKRDSYMEISLSELEDCIPLREEQADELRGLLERFLYGLDALDRRLFVGRYWYAYPVQSMAEANGMTPNAVTLRLSRTRERLRDFLEQEGYHV